MSALPAPRRAWPDLSTALRAVFALLVLVLALSLVVDGWRLRMVSRWIADRSTISLSEARASDSWAIGVNGVLVLLPLATLVLFIIWLYQAHASPAMNRDFMEHKSGWAIGAWFVPIMNLFRPLQMVEDVRRGSHPDFRNPRALTVAWWLLLVFGQFMNRIASGLNSAPAPKKPRDALSSFHDYVVVSTVADVL